MSNNLSKWSVFCLCSFELKLIELIEDDPYETIVSYTVPELITAAIEGTIPVDFGNIYPAWRDNQFIKRKVRWLLDYSLERIDSNGACWIDHDSWYET